MVVNLHWETGICSDGSSLDIDLHDLIGYNVTSKLWMDFTGKLKGQQPSAREVPCLASVNGNIYVFGGKDSNGTWEIEFIRESFQPFNVWYLCMQTVLIFCVQTVLVSSIQMIFDWFFVLKSWFLKLWHRSCAQWLLWVPRVESYLDGPKWYNQRDTSTTCPLPQSTSCSWESLRFHGQWNRFVTES